MVCLRLKVVAQSPACDGRPSRRGGGIELGVTLQGISTQRCNGIVEAKKCCNLKILGQKRFLHEVGTLCRGPNPSPSCKPIPGGGRWVWSRSSGGWTLARRSCCLLQRKKRNQHEPLSDVVQWTFQRWAKAESESGFFFCCVLKSRLHCLIFGSNLRRQFLFSVNTWIDFSVLYFLSALLVPFTKSRQEI